jgi:dUTP pyrophosphatase
MAMTDKIHTAEYTGDIGQMYQAYPGDAGFDLAYNGDTPLEVAPQTLAKIPTGVCVAMPEGMYAIITGRSSTFAKRNLLTPVSIIDSGFRGELFAVVQNFGTETQQIQPGERVIQLLPMFNVASVLRWNRVSSLSPSVRAEHGFGSSGR